MGTVEERLDALEAEVVKLRQAGVALRDRVVTVESHITKARALFRFLHRKLLNREPTNEEL